MNSKTYTLSNNNRFEILSEGDTFVGLGKIWIGDTLVRSGRLPMKVYSQTFRGQELVGLKLLGVDAKPDEVRIRTQAQFRPMPVKVMRDHSFDPIHELGDWDADRIESSGQLDLVLKPATDAFNDVTLAGFSYHYEYRTENTPIFWLMDQASWELDGNIEGATAVSQSSCSAPVATFAKDTAWTTEGYLHFFDAIKSNPVMTHNLPRWASHGTFDFQYKGDKTLVGVFERVELIRSVIVRDANKPELKTFDKHIFDETSNYKLCAKKILLNTEPKTRTGQQNLWTWMFEEIDDRARAEFGLKEVPFYPVISQNFWDKFTVDSYYTDLLPAAAAVGARKIFVDNLKKSSMTERAPMPGNFNWNMCCGHEYEISDKLGGVPRVKRFVEDSLDKGVIVQSWTNNDQSLGSPLNKVERDWDGSWYIMLEDTRQKWAGAYMGCLSALDLSIDEARNYFVETHAKIAEETGLNFWLFDSFYNFGFFPVSYRNCKPHTVWRGVLQAFKELQEKGIRFTIESFGAFGSPQHGHPSSYNVDTIFACIRVGVGNDYTTVPTDHPLKNVNPHSPEGIYYALAHMAFLEIPLQVDGKRVDKVWNGDHKQALKDYHEALPHLKRRFMQEDTKSVIWHDKDRTRATLFNFADRTAALPGKVKDLTTGLDLPAGKSYDLKARHTYVITGTDLPVTTGA